MPGRQESHAARMPARQETPSVQLGALLLRGHTMLAECCQDCNIPLMRDPGTLQSLCVGCHGSFTPAEVQALNAPQQQQQQQEQPPAAEPAAVSAGPLHAAAPGAVAPATAGQQSGRAMNGPLTSALARHHRRTNSNGGSSDGGAASPNLLPAHAPITPAGAAASAGTLSPQSVDTPAAGAAAANGNGNAAGVQQLTPGSTHSQDAANDEVLQAYQQIRAERQRAEQQQSLQRNPQPQAGGRAAAAADQAQRQQPAVADVPQLMADKMLAGWALLGDHCPLCSTPLMRERETRQVHCVACNLPVHLEQQTQTAAAASGASTDRSTRAEPSAQQQQQDHSSAGAASAAEGVGVTTRTGAAAAAAGLRALVQPSGQTAPVAAAAGRGVSAAPSKQQVLSDLQAALLLKLQEAREHLMTIPTSQHDTMGQQLQLIQTLLQTLGAVAQQ